MSPATIQPFSGLDALTWHRILQLRAAIFIIEQYCPYSDPDDYDLQAYHMYLMADDRAIAYLRILPPGIVYTEASIGRIAFHPDIRGRGWGVSWVQQGLDWLADHYPNAGIRISAQSRLIPFYERLDFQVSGTTYLEDGIPHVAMVREHN